MKIIEIPRFRIGLQKHDTIVVDQIFRLLVHLGFWGLPFSLWKIYELVKPFYEMAKSKGWIG
jgi:hypothetical protein